jgi:arabinan endo-1,5-alpha-L-arabinosidase
VTISFQDIDFPADTGNKRRREVSMRQAAIWSAALILGWSVFAYAQPATAPAGVVGVDLTLGWTLVQVGDTQGSVQQDATNPANSKPHLLRIIVTKTAAPGGGRIGAVSSVPIAVQEGQWFDVSFLAQPERGSIGLVFSLESGDGEILARTTLPEIGRRGRRGASTTPAAPMKYQVSLHARASDRQAHLVITPIEPTNIWLGELMLTPRTPPVIVAAADDPKELLRKFGARDVGVHDPSAIIQCNDEYWIFFTGNGVPSIHSRDLVDWVRGPQAFTTPPAWAAQAIAGFRGANFWAPDIIKIGGRYMLFFSASVFGKNTSAIGVATNPTLDPGDRAYHWTDGGLVVRSTEADDFNAIDPAAMLDKDGKLWLSFGSFWSGIQLIELDPATGRRIAPDSPRYSLAHWDAIEGSYLYRHDDHYYLFVSMGMCCRGINSTYQTRVGRSEKVTGPYLDKDGVDLLLGGGTAVALTDGPLIGPGQPGIFEENGKYWFSCHFYDGMAGGASKLSIRPLTWSADGWPVLGEMGQ